MIYDKRTSIFDEDNMLAFISGLHNAQKIRFGIDGGDPFREDVGRSMVAIMDAEKNIARMEQS